MFDRFVSTLSLLVVLGSLALFGSCAWAVASGAMSQGDGFFVLGGCLLTGMVFTYRFVDPAYLEALSVVKGA